MGRLKKFNREEVLTKAMPVFWSRGFAGTSVQDIEKATGVNKSGLYAEFKDKEDLFLECLNFYYATRIGKVVLTKKPLGWGNIEKLLKVILKLSPEGQKGCFGVNSMRELEHLPLKARKIIDVNRAGLNGLFILNVQAEKTKLAPESIAELISTFFSGLCVESNLKASPETLNRMVEDFIKTLRSM